MAVPKEDIFHWVFDAKDLSSLLNGLEYVLKQKPGKASLKICMFTSTANVGELQEETGALHGRAYGYQPDGLVDADSGVVVLVIRCF